jgi:hypothetical protein
LLGHLFRKSQVSGILVGADRCVCPCNEIKELLHFKRGGARRAEGIKLQKSKSKKLLRFLKRRCHEVTEEIIKQTTKPE